MRNVKYSGRIIRGCADAAGDHSGRWIIQTYHEPTGNPWSDELCPHYPSLRAAKETILADIAAEAREKIKQAIAHHEWLSGCYWWSGDNGNGKTRERRERQLGISLEVADAGHVYSYSASVQVKRHYVTYHGRFELDGVKRDVRLFRRLLDTQTEPGMCHGGR